MGTEAKNIRIKDIAVNPISKKIYCAVENMDGTPVLLKLEGEKIQSVSLKDIEFSTALLPMFPGKIRKTTGAGHFVNQLFQILILRMAV